MEVTVAVMAAAEATVVLAWEHKFAIATEYVMMLFFLTFSTMESGRMLERGRGCFEFDGVECDGEGAGDGVQEWGCCRKGGCS